MAKNKSSLRSQIESFSQRTEALKRKNYQPLFVYNTEVGMSRTQAEIKNSTCNCDANIATATALGTELVHSRYRSVVSTPDTLGTPGKGYIKTGSDDRLYTRIKHLAQALPTTESTLRYLIELLCGSGGELMYHYASINQYGDPEEKTCKFSLAGDMLRAKIARLRAELDNEPKDPAPVPVVPSGIGNKHNGPDIDSYRTRQPEPKPDPYATRTYDRVGTTRYELDKAIEDLRTWERSFDEWMRMKDNSTDLDVLLQQWASDQTFFNLSYLKLTLEQGDVRSWGTTEKGPADSKRLTSRPKIIGVNYLSTDTCRMEEQLEDLLTHYIYYSEKLRYDKKLPNPETDMVAYPCIMPQCRKRMLDNIVLQHQGTTPSERPFVAMPILVPQFDSPYYPFAPWWSIFSAMLYNLAFGILNDAVNQRNNSGMFSYIIYLNMTWFEKYIADNNIEGDDEIDKAKHEYIQRISDFLKNRTNNGKIAALESVSSADEKAIIKSIEIVPVPQPTSKASLEDMELVSNAVFFAFGVHGSAVGSFGKTTVSSSGTQQRELAELKISQLSPYQRLYLSAWDFILRWNDFDPHAHMHIKHYTLTTLDASKTGLKEQS